MHKLKIKKLPDILVEYYMFHMYARENVKIWMGLFEGIDHMVRYI